MDIVFKEHYGQDYINGLLLYEQQAEQNAILVPFIFSSIIWYLIPLTVIIKSVVLLTFIQEQAH